VEENEVEQRPIQIFLVTSDSLLVTRFTDACEELGIEVRSTLGGGRLPEELGQAKYEGVLIDFDGATNPLAILTTVRQSPSNRNSVIFAVATQAEDRQRVLANGMNLLFERPFDAREIRRVLHGAYDLMVRERRRYFRCAAEIPVLLIRTRSEEDFRCTTMNVSSRGVALKAPSSLESGEEIQLILFLRENEIMIRAIGTVVWDDKHGKTGISFMCANPRHQTELDSWLDAQFSIPSFGRAQFKETSQ
jgi:DNA-binding response OmpR family regulator